MPELPDITVYIEALDQRIPGHTLTQAQIASPFLCAPSSRRWPHAWATKFRR